MILDNMDTTELENLRVSKLKEKQQYMTDKQTVKVQVLELNKQIKELELRLATLRQALSMATFNLMRVETEIEEITALYWHRRNG